jgi:cell wall-associated NlpC family hydrolase
MIAQLTLLDAAAHRWVGTPFGTGDPIPGVRATCHKLVAEILREAGLLPAEAQIPDGPLRHSHYSDRSLIAEWFDGDGANWFAPISPGDHQPGDLLGARIGRAVHHLILCIPSGYIHTLDRLGCQIMPALPSHWLRRIEKAWRPRLLLAAHER